MLLDHLLCTANSCWISPLFAISKVKDLPYLACLGFGGNQPSPYSVYVFLDLILANIDIYFVERLCWYLLFAYLDFLSNIVHLQNRMQPIDNNFLKNHDLQTVPHHNKATVWTDPTTLAEVVVWPWLKLLYDLGTIQPS